MTCYICSFICMMASIMVFSVADAFYYYIIRLFLTRSSYSFSRLFWWTRDELLSLLLLSSLIVLAA